MSRGHTSIMKVRVGRVMSSSHLSVQDFMLASECLITSRTVNPEGPACVAVSSHNSAQMTDMQNSGSIQNPRVGLPMRKPEASRVTRSSTPLDIRHLFR